MPLGPDEPNDPGGRVSVSPGNYALTLYRLDWDEMKNDGLDEEPSGPSEVIVLTPAAEAKPVKNTKAVIPFITSADNTSWVARYEIRAGVFHGLLMAPYYWEAYYLNIDAQALAQLGLRFGTGLRAVYGDMVLESVFIGPMTYQEFRARHGDGLFKARPEFGVAMQLVREDVWHNALYV